MFKNRSESNDLIQETQRIFGEFIEPTVISQPQFYKLFKLKMSLGQGAYGTIKCVENCYSQLYAIKESKDSKDTYGLYRQFSVMKKFNHPNLLKAISFFKIKESQKLILFTEYCKFKSLKYYSPNLSYCSFREKVKLSVQIFNGIYALHSQNIMHRDLKPENVLIDQNQRAQICDFGFCTYDQQTDLAKTRRVGTPLYNSPETDSGTYTKKCDIFSYGLIVYFIFSNGKNLFKKNQAAQDLDRSKSQHFKKGRKSFEDLDAPEKIKDLLLNTITQKQEKRYSTIQVQQFWQTFIKENNIKGLRVGELKEEYGSMLFLDEEDQKVAESVPNNFLNERQRLAANLMVIQQNNSKAIKDSEKISKFYRSIINVENSMASLKVFQTINLKTSEKHILIFGCFMPLQIHFENLFEIGTKLMGCHLLSQSKELTTRMEEMLNRILQMRTVLGKNLSNSVNYLQKHQNLIKPHGLFSGFIQSCFQQSKKVQKLMAEGFSEKGSIQNFRAQRSIECNKLFFEAVIREYKIEVSLSKFETEIEEILSRFRREKTNLSSQDQMNLADETLQHIKKLSLLKF